MEQQNLVKYKIRHCIAAAAAAKCINPVLEGSGVGMELCASVLPDSRCAVVAVASGSQGNDKLVGRRTRSKKVSHRGASAERS